MFDLKIEQFKKYKSGTLAPFPTDTQIGGLFRILQ